MKNDHTFTVLAAAVLAGVFLSLLSPASSTTNTETPAATTDSSVR